MHAQFTYTVSNRFHLLSIIPVISEHVELKEEHRNVQLTKARYLLRVSCQMLIVSLITLTHDQPHIPKQSVSPGSNTLALPPKSSASHGDHDFLVTFTVKETQG